MGRLLAGLLLLVGLAACEYLGASAPTVVPAATPNIPATIEAAGQAAVRAALAAQITATIRAPIPTVAPTFTPDIHAIIEEAVQATIAAQTAPIPEATSNPEATPTPVPTATAIPTPTPAPTAAATRLGNTPASLLNSYSIWGRVVLDGSNAPGGTVVTAWIGSSRWDTVVRDPRDGLWALLIPSRLENTTVPGGLDGDTIRFTINGLGANETATWQTAGIVQDFTLHANP